MRETLEIINNLLTETFNDILMIEEAALKAGEFKDLTMTELHTIEAIGMYEPKTMSEVAKRLSITVGTLTVAINGLVKKTYVERYRIESDKRVVKVGLSKKGRLAYRVHEMFHTTMVKSAIEGLNEEEEKILATALNKLNGFLREKYLANQNQGDNKNVLSKIKDNGELSSEQ